MSRKRGLLDEEYDVYPILKEDLSSHFESTYKELLKKIKEGSTYKRMRRLAEKQFFNATEQCSLEMESKNTRLCFADINLLALNLVDDIKRVIDENLQKNFKDSLKEELLKIILSKRNRDEEEASEDLSIDENLSSSLKDDEEEVILETLKDLSRFSAQNVNDIRRQVIEMPLEDTECRELSPENILLSMIKKEPVFDKSDDDDGNVLSGLMNSGGMHGLSSFEVDFDTSSNDEPAEERIAKIQLKNSVVENNYANQVKSMKDMSKPKRIVTDFPSTVQKFLPQRERKPNAKYFLDHLIPFSRRTSVERNSTMNVVSKERRPGRHFTPPLENTSIESSFEIDNVLPRTRGRPRKHFGSPLKSTPDESTSKMGVLLAQKRGRPRKHFGSPLKSTPNESTSKMGVLLTQKRGRPRKHVSLHLENSTIEHRSVVDSSSPRKRGRPKKHFGLPLKNTVDDSSSGSEIDVMS